MTLTETGVIIIEIEVTETIIIEVDKEGTLSRDSTGMIDLKDLTEGIEAEGIEGKEDNDSKEGIEGTGVNDFREEIEVNDSKEEIEDKEGLEVNTWKGEIEIKEEIEVKEGKDNMKDNQLKIKYPGNIKNLRIKNNNSSTDHICYS